jgi:hypothetical protein
MFFIVFMPFPHAMQITSQGTFTPDSRYLTCRDAYELYSACYRHAGCPDLLLSVAAGTRQDKPAPALRR